MTIHEALTVMNLTEQDLPRLSADGIRCVIVSTTRELSRCNTVEHGKYTRRLEALNVLLSAAE